MMAHCEGMFIQKTLLIFLFGILLWFCPLSCLCRNLTALDLRGMQVSQISQFHNNSADLAIDGNSDTNFVYDSKCAHTKVNSNPWWRVDLGTNHCLGRITLVNRGDCCSDRLSGATVRAGVDGDNFNNARCGLPVTPEQALVLGAHIPILCDPPVIARYVSVDIARNVYLALCEVVVEEYPMEDCPQMTTIKITDPCAISRMSTLVFEGKCIVNPRPLSVVFIKTPMQCFISCKMNNECCSFDYVMTSGQCRLYGVKARDLNVDAQPGCLVYAVALS